MFSTDLPAGNDFRILDTLSRTSLAEHHELAAFTCLSPSSTLDGLRRLQVEGLVAFVRHTRTGTSRVRRWHLTPLGITRLAELLGATVGGLLRERPLSAEWLTSLLQRLDAVAAFYRVAQEVASSCDGPIGWRWRIAWPLDALLELPDGRGFALMRLGATLSWKAMRSRIGTLYGMQRVRSCPPALLLLPGNLEAQRLRADMRGRAIDVFAAVDDDVMCAAPGSAVWRTLRDPSRLTFEQVTSASSGPHGIKLQGGGSLARASTPAAAFAAAESGLELLATELSMPARRLLDGLFDWPLMNVEHLEMLLGLSESMMKKTRASLTERGLVCQLRIGETPELRQLNGTRLCLSNHGLLYLGRRDRRREADLLAHWSITHDEAGDDRVDVLRYRLDGRKLRTLARELSHTDGVSDFVATLAEACRANADVNLGQVLPPHRWERWFRYNTDGRSIKPDATLKLEHRGAQLPYLMEFEQRASSPALMEEKLEKYLSYFGSVDTRQDFDGGRPTVLFVFAEEVTASLFCKVAACAAQRPIPMLVSSMEGLAEAGPLGRAWRSPWRMEGGYVSLDVAT